MVAEDFEYLFFSSSDSDCMSDDELSFSSVFLDSTLAMQHDCYAQTANGSLSADFDKITDLSPRRQTSFQQASCEDSLVIPDFVEWYAPGINKLQMLYNSFESPRSLVKEMTYAGSTAMPSSERNEIIAGLSFDRVVYEHLQPFFRSSSLSQEALSQWDKKQGLPPTHARTTLNTGRTRRMLSELLSG